MIVNLKEILSIATEKNIAIAAFNTPTFENLIAAINVGEKFNIPIIIQHAQVHESVMPLKIIGPCMVKLAQNSSTKICVHLDHGEDIDYIAKALNYGFTSVMYDGSAKDYEENVLNTKKVVELANKYSAGVEAELGVMGGNEGAHNIIDSVYTDVNLAKNFVEETKIDALAASFGTVHGFYNKTPQLDYQRIADLKEVTGIPIVMHGGSGLNEIEYRESIKNGVKKINYYSYSAKAAIESTVELIRKKEPTQFHEVMMEAIQAIEENYFEFVKVLYNIN